MATNPVFFGYYAGTTVVDMTASVDVQNYGLNREDVYQSWTDGNWTDHRDVVRTRIRGSVTLGFRSETASHNFLAALTSVQQADGTVKLCAYVNNVQTVCSFFAFVDTAGAGRWDLKNSRQWQTLTLTISER